MIDLFAGAFMLTIAFPDLPIRQAENPYGPKEFSTYQDCMTAGSILATWMFQTYYYEIRCYKKDSGNVVSLWSGGTRTRK